RVHQRLAPFGLLLAKVPVDVKRLRVERHVGEQHVVHLRHGAAQAMLVDAADYEIVEVEAATRMALLGLVLGPLRHATLLRDSTRSCFLYHRRWPGTRPPTVCDRCEAIFRAVLRVVRPCCWRVKDSSIIANIYGERFVKARPLALDQPARLAGPAQAAHLSGWLKSNARPTIPARAPSPPRRRAGGRHQRARARLPLLGPFP